MLDKTTRLHNDKINSDIVLNESHTVGCRHPAIKTLLESRWALVFPYCVHITEMIKVTLFEKTVYLLVSFPLPIAPEDLSANNGPCWPSSTQSLIISRIPGPLAQTPPHTHKHTYTQPLTPHAPQLKWLATAMSAFQCLCIRANLGHT